MATGAVPTALSVLDRARAGRFTEIRDMFVPQLRDLVSAEALQGAWTAELDRIGPLRSAGSPVSEPSEVGAALVKIPLVFEHGELTLIVGVDGQGRLTGLQLAPAAAAEPVQPWEPPPYADPESFDEQDVTIGSGPLAVPGTLTLPRRSAGPLLPAIVLLAGSGPSDRDGTMGRNKPLKDLAWGLADRGTAVLRFDKVTYAHPDQVENDPDFTVTDEYVRPDGSTIG